MDFDTADRFDKQLDDCNNLADVFELVKQSVRRALSRHRAGLMLGLADLGMRRGYFVGAFHLLGSNIIVMNKTPLKTALSRTDKKTYNAYCFHLLLHEYLHSLGYLEEDRVKELAQEVCMMTLSRTHPATVMAERGVTTFFPKVRYFTEEFSLPEELQLELVKDFDRSNVKYIQ
ncbi:MAG: hypothetical protein NWE97_03720 [Candidatus Bathyarchaeota archaeon]|nr:hypothetical protein [Candidatus Bathyarchaeota archaeon]